MTDDLDFAPPEGLRVRGTVVVIPGRGDSAETYRRFGRRIAGDAYQVRVLADRLPVSDDLPQDLAARLSASVGEFGDALARPLVLVGADASAAALAALMATADRGTGWWPDAIVLAGLPGPGGHDLGSDWESELAVRTHCPVHRAVLTGDESIDRGRLGEPVPDDVLARAYGSTAALPHLLLVGDTDPLADHDALTRLAKALPAARLSSVRGAHHDVLNDLQHRSVAAEVITFLEIVRSGEPLQPIVSAEASDW
jgi:alpha-beta hydrolase superfamily lysophospholipase